MAQKIAFINNKGGSTKTTTCVNLAGCVHTRKPESKILIVESDGQGNATRSFGIDPNDESKIKTSIYDVFMDYSSPEEAILKDVYKNIDLIPANSNMNFLEFDKMKQFEDDFGLNNIKAIRELTSRDIDVTKTSDQQLLAVVAAVASPTKDYFNMLETKMNNIDKEYDYIFFDTPPEIKAVTSSIIAIADKVVIPYEPDAYSIDGVRNILDRVRVIKEQYNSKLEIGGLLAAKYRKTTKLHADVTLAITEYANRNNIPFFSTKIPNTIRFASATAYRGLPATLSNKTNELIDTYYSLLDEMIEKGTITL
ncbi:ParA family protein [Liquorilactobacillus hordei]|uniref:Partition protein ATPase n=1 Tax=Liquorilactobacillus hordei DSM 19519 TaxID=1423759 RepID=A0A0R1MQ79_9LACO|nr:AAA family ATPase [Liquorilactobacillus hordei]KRL07908.1 partition protein ATPase [Liquorilactobacillus hordei DSM 19519]QYH50998.1 AAA family ATPase [Liquorilactobacillus hordei DSM 19519]QYH51145.1 AAA family ATPase [Liquorilactobacillus hordei DSM 19519]